MAWFNGSTNHLRTKSSDPWKYRYEAKTGPWLRGRGQQATRHKAVATLHRISMFTCWLALHVQIRWLSAESASKLQQDWSHLPSVALDMELHRATSKANSGRSHWEHTKNCSTSIPPDVDVLCLDHVHGYISPPVARPFLVSFSRLVSVGSCSNFRIGR